MEHCEEWNRINTLPHYMLRFGHYLMRGFKHQIGDKYGFNKTQLRTLVRLNRNGSQTMSELVQQLNIEKGSMTSVIDSLIDGGFAARERDENDRRRVIISLLDEGRALAQQVEEEMEAHIRRELNKLGEERVKALFELQDLLIDCLAIWENKNESA